MHLMSEEPSEMKSNKTQGVAAGAAAVGVTTVVRPVLAAFGGFLIVIGVPIAMATPIPFLPFGLPIVILGVVLLARNSRAGKRWMQNMLKRHPRLERFAPHWLLNLILGDEAAAKRD